jgi:pimeloyl-ACP methyl ester carboxylesterase
MPLPQPALRGAATLAGRWLATALREPPAIAAPIARDLADCGLVRSVATLLRALDPSAVVDMAAVDVPVLVVRGERDRVCGPATAQRLAERLPHAELTTVPQAAHAMPFAAPAALARIVRSFTG